MPEIRHVIGPPGTGKTTWLAEQVRSAVARGGERILISSLTKAAATEVAGRGLPIEEYSVGTLHAHAYRSLDGPAIAEGRKEIKEWNEHISSKHPNLVLTSDGADMDNAVDGVAKSETLGDEALAEINILRAQMIPMGAWPARVGAFWNEWEAWKLEAGYMDFTDLIEHALIEVDIAPGRPDHIFLDEAQDMNKLEIALAMRWAESAGQLTLVGDPDQNLYDWRGTESNLFTVGERSVLEHSYRLPAAVHGYANRWIQQISNRPDVTFYPREANGSLVRQSSSLKSGKHLIDSVAAEDGRVMILATCAYHLRDIIRTLRDLGIPFHNPYRKKRGDWNPLGGGNGISTWRRVQAFLEWKPNWVGGWSVEDIRTWSSALEAAKVFRRGAKTAIERMDHGAILTDQQLSALMLDEPMTIRLMSERHKIAWYRSALLGSRSGAYEFPMRLLSEGRNLNEEPKVIVGTIHSVKGGEADVVYLFPDLSPHGMESWLSSRRDSIIRQMYVGMTRAKESLVLCQGSSGMGVKW
jgi:DNA helicase-2/ATP-dependent DNA helicase PcrA